MATTLSAGDLAIIGYSADTGGKSFAFVLLRDVEAGTAINFTDNGVKKDGTFRTGEGVKTWTAPNGGATAGTVVTFTNLTGNLNPSTSGDQIIAYQGTSTFLFAINFADGKSTFAGDATNSNTSAVPPGLTFGKTALAFPLDNGAYTGPTSGTKAELLAAIADGRNWTQDDDTPVAYKTAFTVSSAAADTTPPTLVATSPADDATGTAADGAIVLTFSEAVKAGSGSITLTDGAGDTRTLATDDPQLRFSGSTLTIAPSTGLRAGATYHLTIPAGAVTDLAGNAYAGLASGALDFTTAAAAAASLSIAAADAVKAEGDAGTTAFTFTVTRGGDISGVTSVHYAVTGKGASPADAADFAGSTLPSGDVTFAAGETQKTITVSVAGDTRPEPDEGFAVTLSSPTNGATLATASATGTIQDDDSYTHIYDIQGRGATSPLANQTVTTRGVVTALSLGSTKGFYIQDVDGDGDAATSDGIFVFTGAAPKVHEGDLVTVTGTVKEYRPNNAAPGALTTTEITGSSGKPLAITVTGTHALPQAVLIGRGGIVIPNSDIAAANAVYESLEGMLVTVDAPLVVGPTNHYGEIFTVASGGADATGLNARGDLLIRGGTPSFGFTDTQGGDLNPERIQIDPGLGVTLPKVNTGARLASVTGVVGYSFGDYEVLAKAAPDVTQASPLTKQAATLTADATHLLVASYNAENLDPGDGAARFATIADEILTKLNAPDVIALQEVQDNSGPTDDGVTAADRTLQMIVDAVKAGGGPGYAFVDNPFIGNDTNGGEPGGNIRTAFLYRTDRVALVPGSLATIGADGRAITSGPDTSQQQDRNNPFYGSRPPLSATFRFNGQDVTVVNNHFASKGGSAAAYGDAQPPFDAGEVQRAAQAQAVNTYVDGLLAAHADAKVLVAGDLNEFGFEQPLSVLRGVASVSNYRVPGTDPKAATADYAAGGTQVLNDLQDTLPADQRFDYVYEGNAETLDHMLATDALAAGAAFQPVHINSEFSDQTSDHDPLIARFSIAPWLTAQVTVSGQASFALPTDGKLTVAKGPAVLWNLKPATTGANATLDNAGAITATRGRAIDTDKTPSGGNHFTLLNRAGASITSPGDAVRINADLPNGVVSVDNAGSIRSTGTGDANGQALDFANIVSASAATRIVNRAGGVIAATDADAIRPGANATVENAGTITGAAAAGSTGNDGIDFQDTGYGTVHNLTGGTLTGARHGITGKLPITLVNEAGASITGQLGSGLNLDTAPDSTAILTNAGTITGTAGGTSDGDGIDVDGGVTLDNSGLIEALGTWSGGLSEAVTVGGGTIRNRAGGVIRSVQRAITVDDSNLGNAPQATAITNEGLIEGKNGEAIVITDLYSDTLTNAGTIRGSVALGGGDDVFTAKAGSSLTGAVTLGDGADTATLEAGATVTGAIDGGAGADTLINAGTITGDVGLGDGDDTLTNAGTITGTIDLGAGNDTLTLTTTGTVTGAIDGGAGDDTLILTGPGAATLSSPVARVEHLAVAGGTWGLAARGAGFADIDVRSGAAIAGGLAVSGAQRIVVEAGGAVTASSDPALVWTGAATGAVVENAGTIGVDSPWNWIEKPAFTNAGPYGASRGTGSLSLTNRKETRLGVVAISGDLGSGGSFSLDNAGTITRATATTLITVADTGAAPVILTNSGTISGAGKDALLIDIRNVQGLVISNSGVITGSATDPDDAGRGAIAVAGTGGSTLTNTASGTVTGGIALDSGDDVVTNLGAIAGGLSLGDGNDTLINAGTIAGRVETGAGDDHVINRGTIEGDLILGDGNDTLDAVTGSFIAGTIDGGDGFDTLNLSGPGRGEIGGLSHVEAVNLLSGDWTLDSEGVAVNLAEGAQTLRLGAGTLADRRFDGTIAGFGVDDQLDLEGIGAAARATLNRRTGILTVHDGATHTLARLTLQGDYTDKAFHVASDGTGGTLLTVAPDLTPKLRADVTHVSLFGSVRTDAAHGVLANDAAVAPGARLSVSGIGINGRSVSITPGGSATLAGTYGTLTLRSDGSYSYASTLPGTLAVFRRPDLVPFDSFTYTVSDGQGHQAESRLTATTVASYQTYVGGTDGNDVLSAAALPFLPRSLGLAFPSVLDAGNGDDRLTGGSSPDVLIAGTGHDTLTGGQGPDTFVFKPDFGQALITDFRPGQDALQFDRGLFADDAAVRANWTQVGADLVIAKDEDHTITLQGVQAGSLHPSDIRFA
ncbi:Ig-like domain-containing protein [Methylobacterium sp. JK268]